MLYIYKPMQQRKFMYTISQGIKILDHNYRSKMYSKTLLSVVLCFISVGAVPPRDQNWPADLSTPFPYPTPSPINIESNQTKPSAACHGLKIRIIASEQRLTTNTGYAIEVRNQQPTCQTSVSGGFLKDSYFFEGTTFYWSNGVNVSASASTDGEGTPVSARYAFRNKRYPTSDEACRHRDGYVILQVDVKVEGYTPNPLFEPFCRILEQIKEPGKPVVSSSGPLYLWLDKTIVHSRFYAYPGSLIDNSRGGTQYDCATILSVPNDLQSIISIPQFESFQFLRNGNGQVYSSTLTPAPRGCRPVIEAQEPAIVESIFS